MWLNVIQAELISSQYVQQPLGTCLAMCLQISFIRNLYLLCDHSRFSQLLHWQIYCPALSSLLGMQNYRLKKISLLSFETGCLLTLKNKLHRSARPPVVRTIVTISFTFIIKEQPVWKFFFTTTVAGMIGFKSKVETQIIIEARANNLSCAD